MPQDGNTGDIQDQINRNSRAIQGWTNALGGAVSGTAQFAGALISGSNKLSEFTGSVSTFARALPIPGIETLASGLDGTAKLLDEINAGYKGLSRAGFSLRGSLTGTALAASDAGMSVAEFGKFAESNAKSLRLLGGTGGRASAMLAQMSREFSNSTENYVKGLSAIGFSNEEINETLVNFATINRAQFIENVKTGTSQNASAMRFAVAMDRMATLTNQSRKELQKKMEEDRRQGRVQAFLATLNAEQQEAFQQGLQLAKQNGPLAQKAYEDMMMQASLTGESANAAAVYGSEYIQNLAGMRNQLFGIQAGDTTAVENFTNETLRVQGVAMDGLRSNANLQVAMLRANNGYIKDVQDALSGSVDLYDQISLVQAQAAREGLQLSRSEARLRMNRMNEQELEQAGLTRAADGSIQVAGAADAATDAVSSFESTIATASRAMREELIDTLMGPTGVGSKLRELATGLDSARVDAVAAIRTAGNEFRVAVGEITAGYQTTPVTTPDTTGQDVVQGAINRGNAQELDTTVTIPPREINNNVDNNVFGGMLDALRPSIVGERGPEFLVPKGANNLIATAKQMASQIAPQMQQMAEQMRPQMEQMASQFEPQLQAMASQMQRNAPEMGQQMEVMMSQLTSKFDQLLDAYKDNTREIRRSGGNVYRT